MHIGKTRNDVNTEMTVGESRTLVGMEVKIQLSVGGTRPGQAGYCCHY